MFRGVLPAGATAKKVGVFVLCYYEFFQRLGGEGVFEGVERMCGEGVIVTRFIEWMC